MLNSWDDVVSDFDDWLILLNHLDDSDGLEHEVWAIARMYEKVPHFGNIRQSLVAERLSEAITQRWPFLEVEYHINAICSYFSINGEPVTTLRDLDAAIGAYCPHDPFSRNRRPVPTLRSYLDTCPAERAVCPSI